MDLKLRKIFRAVVPVLHKDCENLARKILIPMEKRKKANLLTLFFLGHVSLTKHLFFGWPYWNYIVELLLVVTVCFTGKMLPQKSTMLSLKVHRGYICVQYQCTVYMICNGNDSDRNEINTNRITNGQKKPNT